MRIRVLLGGPSSLAAVPANAAVPRRHLAIVTCMDARVDVFRAFDLAEGDAHVIRNAGAVVTDDVLRSLVLSQRLLETRTVWIVGHTDCGLRKVDEQELLRELAWETGRVPPFPIGSFRDLAQHVHVSVAAVRECPWLPHHDDVHGFVYDVDDHTVRDLETGRPVLPHGPQSNR
jgi:carbonic anhydrase